MLGGRVDKRLRGALRASDGKARRGLPGGRRVWVAGGAVVVAGAVWLLWPGDDRPDPRARVYTEASACLLTSAAGVADQAAAPVWAGMQQASLATRGKVSFLEVTGAQTGDNAATYLGTLTQGGCDLILVAGSGPLAGLEARAAAYSQVKFVAVGKGTVRPNVTVVPEADAARTTEKVRALVHDALAAAG